MDFRVKSFGVRNYSEADEADRYNREVVGES